MQIDTRFSKINVSTNIDVLLEKYVLPFTNNKIFILVDENTEEKCLPLLKSKLDIQYTRVITIPAGEEQKHLQNVELIWKTFVQFGADRSSLLINLGGGMVCDMGGFAAASFKRGISFINIPTTLLAQVDASVGGKTGFNYLGFKNEIGFFAHPQAVIINSEFLRTLDDRNILAGWAEMIKHNLIFDVKEWEVFKHMDVKSINYADLNQLIARSVKIKKHFVESDPNEKSERKVLNFGHTVGHALESYFLKQPNPLLHGEAVAYGIVCELFLSFELLGFPKAKLDEVARYVLNLYGVPDLNPKVFGTLADLMVHDKKNKEGEMRFVLLQDIGKPVIDVKVDHPTLINSLEKYANFKLI